MFIDRRAIKRRQRDHEFCRVIHLAMRDSLERYKSPNPINLSDRRSVWIEPNPHFLPEINRRDRGGTLGITTLTPLAIYPATYPHRILHLAVFFS